MWDDSCIAVFFGNDDVKNMRPELMEAIGKAVQSKEAFLRAVAVEKQFAYEPLPADQPEADAEAGVAGPKAPIAPRPPTPAAPRPPAPRAPAGPRPPAPAARKVAPPPPQRMSPPAPPSRDQA